MGAGFCKSLYNLESDTGEVIPSENSENCAASAGSRRNVEDEKAIGNDYSVLLTFYETLLEDLRQRFSIEYSDVTSSIECLISNYQGVVYGQLPQEIDYTNIRHCLGYLHRYAACHTALVMEAVTDIFESSSSNVLTSKLDNNNLNAVFLGSGPGNDLVGFLSALHGKHQNLSNMDVTVVDKMSGWNDIFTESIQKLRKGGCGKASSIFDSVNVNSTFMAADLKDSREWSSEMQMKLKNADVIFLVKALSHIPDGDKHNVLQNIINHMKLGALLIYVDFPYPYQVFFYLGYDLKLAYKSSKTRYNLNFKVNKFGCENITTCQAEVRAFVRY